jgi:hypothetical protein
MTVLEGGHLDVRNCRLIRSGGVMSEDGQRLTITAGTAWVHYGGTLTLTK